MSTSTKTRGTTPSHHPHPNPRRGAHPRTAPAHAAPAPLPRALDTTLTDQQQRELWAMTAQERVDAMNQGRLSLGQLTVWSRRHEAEVPLIGNELAYIARYTPEVCEADQTEARP
jgi:hypothetical protein